MITELKSWRLSYDSKLSYELENLYSILKVEYENIPIKLQFDNGHVTEGIWVGIDEEKLLLKHSVNEDTIRFNIKDIKKLVISSITVNDIISSMSGDDIIVTGSSILFDGASHANELLQDAVIELLSEHDAVEVSIEYRTHRGSDKFICRVGEAIKFDVDWDEYQSVKLSLVSVSNDSYFSYGTSPSYCSFENALRGIVGQRISICLMDGFHFDSFLVVFNEKENSLILWDGEFKELSLDLVWGFELRKEVKTPGSIIREDDDLIKACLRYVGYTNAAKFGGVIHADYLLAMLNCFDNSGLYVIEYKDTSSNEWKPCINGKPIIATRSSVIEEFITNGKNYNFQEDIVDVRIRTYAEPIVSHSGFDKAMETMMGGS